MNSYIRVNPAKQIALLALLLVLSSCARKDMDITSSSVLYESFPIGDKTEVLSYEIGDYWSRMQKAPSQQEVSAADVFVTYPEDWVWYQGRGGQYLAVRILSPNSNYVLRFDNNLLFIKESKGDFLVEGYRWYDQNGVKIVWPDTPDTRPVNAIRSLGNDVLHVRGYRVSEQHIDAVQETIVQVLQSAAIDPKE